MVHFRQNGIILILGFAVFSFAVPVRAGSVASGYEYATEANNTGGQLTIGAMFHTNSGISIDALGLGAFVGPITYDHAVGLWDSTGHLLASTIVTTSDPLVGHFQFHALASPVQLAAGVDFVVGAQNANPLGGAADPWANQLFNVAVDPRVTLVDTRVHDDLVLAFPERVTGFTSAPAFGGLPAYDSGTFSANFQISAVPEPSSLTLVGLGIASVMGFYWRRKSNGI
jgi:Domain of unknown function (DUF4082)/PEP-CTERM motif